MQLRREFQSIIGLGDIKPLKDEWLSWIQKIRGVGEVEGASRKAINVLVKQIDEASECSGSGKYAFLCGYPNLLF